MGHHRSVLAAFVSLSPAHSQAGRIGGVPWSEDEGSQCGLAEGVTASCFLTGQEFHILKTRVLYVK